MRVMILKPGELAEVINIRAVEISGIVGGIPKEIFPFSDKIGIYINEDRKGLPLNRSVYNKNGGFDGICAGTMVIASEDGDLTDEEIIKLLNIFGEPEKWPDEEEAAELEECFDKLITLLDKIFPPKKSERSAK